MMRSERNWGSKFHPEVNGLAVRSLLRRDCNVGTVSDPIDRNRVGQTQSPGCSICGLWRLPLVDSRRLTQPDANAAIASVKITIVTHSGSTPILNDPTHSKNPAIHADHMSFCIFSPLAMSSGTIRNGILPFALPLISKSRSSRRNPGPAC
jgi:hypothetical protein